MKDTQPKMTVQPLLSLPNYLILTVRERAFTAQNNDTMQNVGILYTMHFKDTYCKTQASEFVNGHMTNLWV